MWHEEYTNNAMGVYRNKKMYIKYKNTKMYQKGTLHGTRECHLVTYTYIYYINRNKTGWPV